ncbi:MAG: M90 family metallopeptidase [Polyangia bacterium]
MFGFIRKRRRAQVCAQPFPEAWREHVRRNVPYTTLLTGEEHAELLCDIQIFMAEKRFEGCGGLELTDEIRVTIAAQACLLLLHRDTEFYPDLSSILVYPSTYLVPGGQRTPDGLVTDDPQARLGESWERGVVILAWDSVLSGAADIHDGHNVVLHEFAHQLDQENNDGPGVPQLPRRSMYVAWARVLGHDYAELLRETHEQHRTLIDRYGATNPAEFFAVVTETFFERPRELLARQPALYEQMRAFYQQDPATRYPHHAVEQTPVSNPRGS